MTHSLTDIDEELQQLRPEELARDRVSIEERREGILSSGATFVALNRDL